MAVTDSLLVPRINKLPEFLANQIAAGEVVERPASIVKELVENSIDAGANSIDIDISGGGIDRICVRDNGHGIHPDDLHLTIERHATSKLKSQYDLEHIQSLGFRGEAIPSIASVAHFTLISRVAGSDSGQSVKINPMTEEIQYLPAAHPVGTTVEVNNLFQVHPARRKFLRSERTEYLHILELTRRLALATLSADFRLKHNGKQVLSSQSKGNVSEDRVQSVLGKQFISNAIPLDYADQSMRIWGWLGPSELSRSQSDRQFLFLNNRIIRDKQINHAIRLAFGEDIPPGRYPSFLLYLEMDSVSVDVNVHPTKQEVRFRHARDVHDFVYSCLHDCLQARARVRPVSSVQLPGISGADISSKTFPEGHEFVNESIDYYYKPGHGRSRKTDVQENSYFGVPLLHLQGRFLITENTAGENYLIDIHAVKKYTVSSQLTAALESGNIKQRPILVPVHLGVSRSDLDLVETHNGLLKNYGFEIDLLSETEIIIRAIPTLLADANIRELVRDLLAMAQNNLSRGKDVDNEFIDFLSGYSVSILSENPDLNELIKIINILEREGKSPPKSMPGLYSKLSPGDFINLLNK